jgi:general stress protein 26
MKSEKDKLYSMIEDIEIAMMTTRRSDGHLRSRAHGNSEAGRRGGPVVCDK